MLYVIDNERARTIRSFAPGGARAGFQHVKKASGSIEPYRAMPLLAISNTVNANGLATYPANLCPFLFGAEFSDREEDLGDAVGQAVEDATFTAIGKRTAEHFQHVLCGLE